MINVFRMFFQLCHMTLRSFTHWTFENAHGNFFILFEWTVSQKAPGT